ATAFLPPTPAQLIKDPQPGDSPTLVGDPKTGQSQVSVLTVGGGNPALQPQDSRSLNAGIIWAPRWRLRADLRLNVEYYKIEQFNAIGSLTASQIVGQESIYPDRVTRNGSGTITLVDISAVNLYRRETEGWDLNADFSVPTGI